MEKQAKKFFQLLSGLLLIFFFLLALTVNSQKDRTNLEVDFLDVGQGDAILIKTPYEQNILIDGGPDNSILPELGRNLAFFDKDLDLVVLTHPHDDHVAGLVEILRRYKVKKVLLTGVLHTAPDYLAFLDEIEKQNIKIEIANSQRDIVLGDDLVLKILYPWSDLQEQKFENLNNTSIVAKLVYKNNSFLFTGDAEKEVEDELIQSDMDLSAQVLKVGHHGSKTSSSQEFLDKVNPQFAIISVGQDNKFGHPDLRTINTLGKSKIEILQTDLLGTIKFIADGENLQNKNRD